MKRNFKILVVDDDYDIVELLQLLLEGEGYVVQTCYTGEDALTIMSAENNGIDLVIMDIMLPGKNGFKVCGEVRKVTNVPILFLSAMSGESDKYTGFLSGGDDYICKPFATSELVSRVKALLRRCYVYQDSKTSSNKPSFAERDNSVNHKADFSLTNNTMNYNGEVIELTYIESEILHFLLSNRGKVLSSEAIFDKVWGDEYNSSANNTVMVHILNLRRKIENGGARPRIIKTAWGKGYYID